MRAHFSLEELPRPSRSPSASSSQGYDDSVELASGSLDVTCDGLRHIGVVPFTKSHGDEIFPGPADRSSFTVTLDDQTFSAHVAITEAGDPPSTPGPHAYFDADPTLRLYPQCRCSFARARTAPSGIAAIPTA
jgi:hypothetical protein